MVYIGKILAPYTHVTEGTEMKPTQPPNLQGNTFLDILQELHQAVFKSVPDETDPFILTERRREYVAYVLAMYYDCGVCEKFHSRKIQDLQKTSQFPNWKWRTKLDRTVLFLQTDKRYVSERLWSEWLAAWNEFVGSIDKYHPNLSAELLLAVGIARKDRALMKLAVRTLRKAIVDKGKVRMLVRDVDRVVVFMKSATGKNRTDAYLLELLEEE